MSLEEHHALAGALPYTTVNDRVKLINAAFALLDNPCITKYDARLGYRTPHEMLMYILANDSRAKRKSFSLGKVKGVTVGDQKAIRQFCQHEFEYGHDISGRRKGPLGSVTVIQCGRKKYVRWHAPLGDSPGGTLILNFEMLLHELATNTEGQHVPVWYDENFILRLD